jgi:hypothetical protein
MAASMIAESIVTEARPERRKMKAKRQKFLQK